MAKNSEEDWAARNKRGIRVFRKPKETAWREWLEDLYNNYADGYP